MTARSLRSQAVRGFLVCAIALSSLAGPGASWLLVVLAAIVLAYDGPTDAAVYGMLALLVGVELIYGIPLGVLSIAYAAAVACFVLAGRFVSLAAWASLDGWRVGDILRTLICGLILFCIMAVVGVAVGAVFYGSGAFMLRLQMLPLPPPVWLVAVGIGVLVILRRADEPFRRPVIFGV